MRDVAARALAVDGDPRDSTGDGAIGLLPEAGVRALLTLGDREAATTMRLDFGGAILMGELNERAWRPSWFEAEPACAVAGRAGARPLRPALPLMLDARTVFLADAGVFGLTDDLWRGGKAARPDGCGAGEARSANLVTDFLRGTPAAASAAAAPGAGCSASCSRSERLDWLLRSGVARCPADALLPTLDRLARRRSMAPEAGARLEVTRIEGRRFCAPRGLLLLVLCTAVFRLQRERGPRRADS